MAKILFDGIEYNECYVDDTRIGKINFTDAEGDISSPFVMEWQRKAISQSGYIKTVYIYDAADYSKGTSSVSRYCEHGEEYLIAAELNSSDSTDYFPVIYTQNENGKTNAIWHNEDYNTGDTSATWVETSSIIATKEITYNCTALPRIKSPVITAYNGSYNPGDGSSTPTIVIQITNPNNFDVTITEGTINFYEKYEIFNTYNFTNRVIGANDLITYSELAYSDSFWGVEALGIRFTNYAYNDIMNIPSTATDYSWGDIESESTTTTEPETIE